MNNRTRNKHYTRLEGYVKPTRAAVQKAKNSLNIPNKVKLPRCMAKSPNKVKGFEREGDFSHSKANHVCDLCRCGFRAGFGTSHLGMGYCIVHEHSAVTRSSAKVVAEAHKIAIRQGYPDKAYVYAQTNPDSYVAEIRKAAEDAGGMTDLREDIHVVRDEVQKILDSWNGGKFQVRVKKVSGAGASRQEEFVLEDADDVEKAKVLTQLMRVLSKMSIDNLKLTEDDVVTYDQVKMFAAGVINLIERMAPSAEFTQEFIGEFAKILNNVKTGRK